MPSHRIALGLALILLGCSQGGGEPVPTPVRTPSNSGGSGPNGGQTGAPGGAGGNGGGAGSPAGSGGATGGAAPAEADAQDPAADARTDEVATPPGPGPAAGPICPPGPFEAPKPGAVENVCPGFQVKYNWNEGPTWVPSQHAFFFSNFMMRAPGPGDMIKYDPATNKCEFFIEGNGCNGLTPDRDGNLLAVCHTPRALLKYDLTTKKSTVVLDMVEGKMLDSPNDIVTHSNGTIYFSNTTLELAGRPLGLGAALLRIDPAGMVSIIARGSINPLGISPDQKRLYAMGGYWDLDDAGVPIKKAGGFTLGPDGIGVDCAGNVYIQSGAIVSPQNQVIGHVPGGTNSAFGGEDRKTLLVVGGKGMHTVKMNLPGLP